MNENVEIVIVEDDAAVRRVLELTLKSAGYRVCGEATGPDGYRRILSDRPQLALLDVMLPGMDGLEICRRLRGHAETAALPVVMLTAKGEEGDIVAGLDAGANDYVTKPFSKDVLLARIRAQLRSSGESSAVAVAMDGLVIDESSHTVMVDGRPVALTLSEYRILALLAGHPNRVFTRSLIIDRISDGGKIVTDRTIDVQLVGLRRKLGDWAEHIETIRGVGYRVR